MSNPWSGSWKSWKDLYIETGIELTKLQVESRRDKKVIEQMKEVLKKHNIEVVGV